MFRGAVRGDLAQILKIYAHARAAMKESGNPTQWGDNFPPQELLEEDIDSNRLFLYVVNGQIEAVFAFILGADPTYAAIEDGQWLDDTLPYGTVHRLASAGNLRLFLVYAPQNFQKQLPLLLQHGKFIYPLA